MGENGAHADEHFANARLRLRKFAELNALGGAGSSDERSFHSARLRSARHLQKREVRAELERDDVLKFRHAASTP